MCLGLLWAILQVTDKQMPILASSMFPNAYGKVGGVAVATGANPLTSVGNDVFIVKYNSSGKSIWAAKITSAGSDLGYGITTDSSGNVYVTGQAGGGANPLVAYNADGSIFLPQLQTSAGSDTFIVKYNTDGVVQWVTRLASNANDIGWAIATDSSGNIYLTGQYGSGSAVPGTVFNSDGTVFGTLANSGSSDTFVIKYNGSGFVQWVTRIASTQVDIGFGIATDSSGNVYVTGQSGSGVAARIFNSNGTNIGSLTNSGGTDAIIVKYDTNGFAQWATRVSTNTSDIGYAIATDTSGNLYVTGQGGSGSVISAFNANGTAFATTLPNAGGTDAFIVKYNTSGVVQWVARVASTGADIGFGITTDTSNSVYVTGQGGNATVTAFNANGTAFGTTLPNAGSSDAFIVKYNTDGVVQWATRIASTSNDIGYAISSDTSGNVYVTGQGGVATVTAFNADGTAFGTILPNRSGNDVFIVKYNTSGVVQWATSLGTQNNDFARAIALDQTSNIYTTGVFSGGSLSIYGQSVSLFSSIPDVGLGDVFVVKYNTNGAPQWVARIASTATDIGFAIATDSSGNVYLTGYRGNAVTTIYNANGSIFGTTSAVGGTDTLVVKYNTDGVAQWVALIGSTGNDIGQSIATDSAGNVYVTGQGGNATVTAFNADRTAFATTLPNAGAGDAFIVKYNTDGAVQWVARVASTGSDNGYDITTDSSGNVYITGVGSQSGSANVTAFNANGTAFATTLPNAGAGDAFIVKYNTDGAVQWVARVASTNLDVGQSIATDSLGNVYVGGNYNLTTATAFNASGTGFGTTLTNNGGSDAFVAKYNTDGAVQWFAQISSTGNEFIYGITADSSGNVYVAGQGGNATVTAFNANGTAFGTILPNTGLGDAFIVKYNTNGIVQWVARLASNALDQGLGIATDTSGNVYVTCASASATTITIFNSNTTIFASLPITNRSLIVKYDTNGFAMWAQVIQSSTSNPTTYSLSVDSTGNAYATGRSAGTTTIHNIDMTPYKVLNSSAGSDVFIVKYSSNTTPLWAARIATTNQNDSGNAIARDSAGNVYVTGSGGGTATLSAFNADGGAFGTTLTTAGGDVFVVKYNTNGTVQWLTKIASSGNDFGRGIQTDTSGNVYVTGFVNGITTAFNANGSAFATTLPNAGSNDAFIVKYNTDGVVQWVARVASTSFDPANAISIDTSGNVYITGQSGGIVTAFNANGTAFATTIQNAGGADAYIVKYNTDGAVQWVARVASTGNDIGNGIATDTSGNVYITGQGGSNVVVTAFNANGTAFGTTLPASGSIDAFIVKYNTNGVVQWIARVAGAIDDVGRAIATDGSGNVYVTGAGGGATLTAFNANGTAFATTLPDSGGGDAFIVKYNTNGIVQWVTKVASTNLDNGYGITTDSAGNVYVSGGANVGGISAFNANGSSLPPTIADTTFKSTESFVVKYDTNGVVQWISLISGQGADNAFGIAVDSSNNIYAVGEFRGSALVPVDA